MICPACGNELTEMTVSDVTLDVCKGGCGGIWFDNFEIKKFDEPHEPAGQELLNIEKNPDIKVDGSRRYKCPKCGDMLLMRHYFSVKKKVAIDECPNCAGIWLDDGELEQIRGLFNSEQEKNLAAEQYMDASFGEDLAEIEVKAQIQGSAIRNMFGFFSYRIPFTR